MVIVCVVCFFMGVFSRMLLADARSRNGVRAAAHVPRPAGSSLIELWHAPQPCCWTVLAFGREAPAVSGSDGSGVSRSEVKEETESREAFCRGTRTEGNTRLVWSNFKRRCAKKVPLVLNQRQIVYEIL